MNPEFIQRNLTRIGYQMVSHAIDHIPADATGACVLLFDAEDKLVRELYAQTNSLALFQTLLMQLSRIEDSPTALEVERDLYLRKAEEEL